MDVWLLISLALLQQTTASEDWTCNFESSCGMTDDEGDRCWRSTWWPLFNDYFYVDCWGANQTAKTTIPNDFAPGRWQLSFRYYSTSNGFLSVTTNCNGSIPVTLDPTGIDFVEQKLPLCCLANFKISFIAVRQTRNQLLGIDDIGVRRQSVIYTPSPFNTALHPIRTVSHHTKTFPSSEPVTTPSSSHTPIVTSAESDKGQHRSSARVSSPVSMTTSALTSTWSPMAENSAMRSDGPSLVIVAVVSIVGVIAVVAMVAIAVLFHRRRMGRKSQNPKPAKEVASNGDAHGNPTFSFAELHEENRVDGDMYVSQDVILARKAAQGESLNNLLTCGDADEITYDNLDSENAMPFNKKSEDNEVAAALHNEEAYDVFIRPEQHAQGKDVSNQQGNGPTDIDDKYQTLTQTSRCAPDVKTHAKMPGSDAKSKAARNLAKEDGSATQHPHYQNLRAEQAMGDKTPVDDLLDDDYYDILPSDTFNVGSAHHDMGKLRHHDDDDASYAETIDCYSVVMSDIDGLHSSAPTLHEPLCSSVVYGELA